MVASCHQILGVGRDATPEQVDDAYLAVAMRAHPDHHAEEPARTIAATRFRQAGEAYRVLVDGMAIGGTLVDPGTRARETFEAAAARHAARLARDGCEVEPLARRLISQHCPPRLAWRLAEISVIDARLARARATAQPMPLDLDPPDEDDQDDDSPEPPSGVPRPFDARRPPPRAARGVGLRARVAAASADALLLCGLVAAPAALLAWHLGASDAGTQRAALLALLVAGTAYHIVAETRWRATLGKHLLGLRVSAADGRRIDIRCALKRHGLRTASHFMLGLPFLLALLDERARPPQDWMTESRVRWDGVDRSELERPLAALPFAALAVWVLHRLLATL